MRSAPVVQVLLDPGVPVEGVDVHLGAVGDDLRLELTGRRASPPLAPPEDQLDHLRAADVEVVGNECLEEPAGTARRVEHQGARHLHLPHRQLPPIAGGAVGVGQRQRQHRPPAFGEHPDRAGPEPVADRLQTSGVGGRGEPVEAQEVFDKLVAVGIDLTEVFIVLEDEGVEKFEKSWQELLDATKAQLDVQAT